jgi:site-specific DNA-methyltransferase (adenine-specific)
MAINHQSSGTFPEAWSPRSAWEPWGLYRKPISERTVALNLGRWGVGGLRRTSDDSPFTDVIQSGSTPHRERARDLHLATTDPPH